MGNLNEKIWWDYLEVDLQSLLEEAFLLIEKVNTWEKRFHDYSFIVFPASKAYEGFLKKLFLDLGFINEDDYYGKHFRIGKALNPSLERQYRERESVYDRIVKYCGGKELANELWETWKNCRNLVFHWFPDEKRAIDFDEAKERVGRIVAAIDASFKECKVKNNGQGN